MSTVEEHFAILQAVKAEKGWLSDRFHYSAAIFLGAHLDELEAAWKAALAASPPVSEAAEEVVWRVCPLLRDAETCKRCPRWEEGPHGQVQRGCFALAEEVVNTVETGNPWRKTDLSGAGLRNGWVSASPPEGDTGWKPISEAPKDRKLWLTDGYDQYVGWWQVNPREEFWMDEADSDPTPTHWRPLPPPPTPHQEQP